MGCGSSVTENKVGPDISMHHMYTSKINKPKEPIKAGIEEARKRRVEGAKERARRASVMGLLEAEKLKERKRSIPSIYDTSENDGLLEEKRQDVMFHESGLKTGITNDHDSNSLENIDLENDISKRHIEIIISPGTRSNSRETINTNSTGSKNY